MIKTKVYKHGGSQVVRIPVDLRLPSDTVYVLQTKTGFQVVDPRLEEMHLREIAAVCAALRKHKRTARSKGAS